MSIFHKIGSTPIKRNIVANLFGVGVRLFNQVLLVPLYLSFWNTELYGDWIVISAISSFFAMSDVGLNSVTANQFAISYAGDRSECNSLLTNNYVIIAIVATISLLGSIGYVTLFDITKNLGLNALGRSEASYIFVALIAKIFITMGGTVINAIYRANSKTETAVYIGNTAILCESIILLISVVTYLPMCIMVTIYMMPRIFIGIYRYFDAKKIYDYKMHFTDFNYTHLKKIFIPSISFMSFPMGNAIVYQGFTLVVNKFLGADAVVSFNTTRTLCTFMRQLLTTMQSAVWPEYSNAYGRGDTARMRSLHRRAFKIANLGAIVLSVGLLLVGPYVYDIWTQGKIAFSYPLVIAFLVVLIVENMWTTSSVCLMATNKHTTIGFTYVSTAAIAICIAIYAAYKTASMPLIEYSLLVIHIPLTIYALRAGITMTQDRIKSVLFRIK